MGQTQEAVLANGPTRVPGVVWEHRMNQPLPNRIPHEDATVDEVQLRGTFNLPISSEERAKVTAEAARVLKPGGRLFVHVLTGKEPVDSPDLPGPASVVRHVPPESEPTRLLADAGLTDVRFLKLGDKPCFVRNGVEMRKTQVEGRKR